MSEHPIFTKEELAQGLEGGTIQSDLPPAGAARNEVLAQRTDTLAQQAETRANALEQGAIDPKVFEPDREIQDSIAKDFLAIGVNHPLCVTRWVNYVNQHGTRVWEAKAEGWQCATAVQFPEARHLLREDNTIRVGDVILMFIRKDEHLRIVMRRKEKQRRQQLGLEANVVSLADKHSDVFTVHTESTGGVPEHLRRTKGGLKRLHAKKTAAQTLGDHLGQGKVVPGVPIT